MRRSEMSDVTYALNDGSLVRFERKAIPNSRLAPKRKKDAKYFDELVVAHIHSLGNPKSHASLICRHTVPDPEKTQSEDGLIVKLYEERMEEKPGLIEAYEAFMAGRKAEGGGLLLADWEETADSLSFVAQAEAMNVRTVEQLAQVSEGNLSNFPMGARKLWEAAKRYADDREALELLEASEKRTKELEQRISELEAAQAPKRGRPPKQPRPTAEVAEANG